MAGVWCHKLGDVSRAHSGTPDGVRTAAIVGSGAAVPETVRHGECSSEVHPGAPRAIAREALKRKSGARGLRAIMDIIMVDPMYEIPSEPNIKEAIISEEV